MAIDKKSKKSDPMSAIIANIEKQMGNKGRPCFSRFGEIERVDVPVIPFGKAAIDEASGCGGVLRGKLVEIFGPESSGKSLLSLYLIASAQKQGLECLLIDIEQSFDAEWAKKWGVNVDKLLYSNTFASGEQALEYAYQFAKSGAVGLIVIDSTAALLPLSELEGTLEENARMGEQARMLSRGVRKITDACGKGNTTCVFINQTRSKIGVMYGSPETTPGGAALRFYSHQRIRAAPKEKIKVKDGAGEKIVGILSTATFVKNKLAMPFGKAEFKIIFDPKSLNPVVMLCNAAKAVKLIRPFNGILRLQKEVTGKVMDSGVTTIPEFADFLIKNNLVIPLLDKVVEEMEGDPTAEPLDGVILEMKDDPTKIVSPTSDEPLFDAEKVDDATIDEIADDIKDQDKPVEE